jgi:hypothetical protein
MNVTAPVGLMMCSRDRVYGHTSGDYTCAVESVCCGIFLAPQRACTCTICCTAQGSQSYPLEAALEVAEQRGMVDEQASDVPHNSA